MSGSQSRSTRSRAVSFPRDRCRSSACSPPPRATAAVRSRSSATSSSMRCRRRGEGNPSRVQPPWRARPSPRSLTRSLEGFLDRIVARCQAERDTQLAPSLAVAPCVEQPQAEQVMQLRVRGCFSMARRRGGRSPGGSASVVSASSGPIDSGSRRRAQRRSVLASARVGVSYARSTRREESHGGEKASTAARTYDPRSRSPRVPRAWTTGLPTARSPPGQMPAGTRRGSSTPSRRPYGPSGKRRCRALRLHRANGERAAPGRGARKRRLRR